MKITAFILLVLGIHVSAATLAQTVTLNEHKAPLEKVINDIKQQTGYSFFYNQDWLQKAQPVDINVKNQPLETALKACFQNQPFDYAIVNKTIVLKLKEKASPPQKNEQPNVPPVTVVGKVVDETGQPLPGVTIKIKNAGGAVASDKDGNFNIAIPTDQDILIFSFIGYETREVSIKGVTKGLVVVMKALITNLQEVVVNKGYYSVKQELNTGNVVRIDGRDINRQPVSDPIIALEGRVSGLVINQTSGIPGAYSTVRLRGQNSILNGNDPLYIVDGVPFSSVSLSAPTFIGPVGGSNPVSNVSGGGLSPFNGLNPADIENIEVLKDGDATAIYGSRGANGVILITTKKGKAGDTRFDLNFFSGAGKVAHQLDLLSTQQYIALRKEAIANDGLPASSIKTDPSNTDYDINGVWDTTRYTNWQKELIGHTASYTGVQGNLSGGSSNTQFMAGFGYSKQGTVYPGDYSDQKSSVHFNIVHNSDNRRFNLQFTGSYVNDNNKLPPLDFSTYITQAPDAPASYNADGSLNWQIYNGVATNNPNLASFTLRKSTSVTNNLISNLTAGYQILPGLTLKGSFGYNRDEMNQTQLTPASSIAPPNLNTSGSRTNYFGTTAFSSWIVEPQINYHKTIGRGNLDMLVGSTFQENTSRSLLQLASGFVSDALITNPQSASAISVKSSNAADYKYTAIYGRIGYNIGDKYLINLTARRDGSSRFGPGKQFGNFGAVGASWIFSKEKFMEDNVQFLSFGKLRASYGVSGNDQIPDYQYLSTYTAYANTYQGIAGLVPARLANPNFAWEVVKKSEVGIELGFLKDRIDLSADYFQNRTGNQLVGFSLPRLAGFTSVQYNLPAVVQNSGIEIQISTTNIKTKQFEWRTDINVTVPENKLVAFPGLESSSFHYSYLLGQSIFSKYVYHYTGVDPQTGLYSFATKNSSNGLTFPDDLISSQPVTQHYYGGIGNHFSYRGFSLDIFIQYVNQTNLNWKYVFGAVPGNFNVNVPSVLLNRWRNPGDLTGVQKLGTYYGPGDVFNSVNNLNNSDGIYDNSSSFLRLKNVSLSYQFPLAWTERMHLHNARVYLQGQNLLTVTKYIGLDPETAGTLSLPPIRMITAGFQIGL